MFEKAYQLLTFFDRVKELSGRKRLQKTIHLLEHRGLDFSFKYEYHHYGPYSFELQGLVHDLVEQGFLQEDKPGDNYFYRITEKGLLFKNAYEESQPAFSFQDYEDLIQKLSEKSSSFLELLSTYAYLMENGYDPNVAKEKVVELKPHLGEWLDEVIQFYDKEFKQ
ncbi:hypothetical protein L1765_02360 [Microaerobacter geothermalis]|uniref:hypothetical protein n=1 Tax=Microaerobacter geothermalis TaxID=674972 RepID=UPI001F37DA13|nr:hypothetical protein [Microaerobacter geothermalis]MCF6092839.1 hypothetical protein [Microaerobacter geothermalis]